MPRMRYRHFWWALGIRVCCLALLGVLLVLPVALPGCATKADKLDAAAKAYLRALSEQSASENESAHSPAKSPAQANEEAAEPAVEIKTPPSKPKEPRSVVRLSRRECLESALQHNTEIQVVALAVPKQRTEVVAAKGIFDPLFYSDNLFTRTDEPSSNQLDPGGGQTALTSDEASIQVGLKQLLPTGAEFGVSQKMSYLDTNNIYYNPNPQYGSVLGLTLTQPLLRGFGPDITMAPIHVASTDYDISIWDFEQQVAKLVADVEAAYWHLVSATEKIRVAEVSLSLAREIERRETLRLQHGEGTSAELERARAAVATREVQLAAAMGEAQNISDELKRLINGPQTSLREDTIIAPTDRFTDEETNVEPDRPAAILAAFENRPELKKAEGGIKARKIAETVAKNDRLPRLDLELQYGLSGLGAQTETAWDVQNDANFSTWSARLLFEVPIGNRAARARHVKAKLESTEAAKQMELARQAILLEVSKAVRAAEISRQQVEAARRAVKALKQTLEGEQAKLDLGVGTIKDVLEAQEDLARAQQEFTLAALRLHLARLELDHATGTLLAERQVEIFNDRTGDRYSEPQPMLTDK